MFMFEWVQPVISPETVLELVLLDILSALNLAMICGSGDTIGRKNLLCCCIYATGFTNKEEQRGSF